MKQAQYTDGLPRYSMARKTTAKSDTTPADWEYSLERNELGSYLRVHDVEDRITKLLTEQEQRIRAEYGTRIVSQPSSQD